MGNRINDEIRLAFAGALLLFALSGCGESIYYSAMEKAGYHKRDILVERVEEARDSQQETKEEFKSALERFASVVKVEGGDLEAKYKELKSSLDACEAQAVDIADRIESVENVSAALFEEWETELAQYHDARLRRASSKKLTETKARYKRLIGAMRAAEKKIEPVLVAFRDQVLFLKHNLNAKAVAGLQKELATVETDIAELIKEMEKSIAEADSFIRSMETE
jgi:chromosome segregation ATPase